MEPDPGLNSDGDFGDTNEVVYYHSNTLHSIYALSDGSENVVDRYRYSAYGQSTVLDPDWSVDADAASDAENPYRFTARRLDAETGLMQYRNRYYSPGLGRFVSRDPAGYFDGLSLYEYAVSQPSGFTDPFGLGVGDLLRNVGGRMKRGARRIGGWGREVGGRAKRGARRVGDAVRTGYDRTVQAGVNYALTGKTNPTGEELGAGYLGLAEEFVHAGSGDIGYDTQAEGHVGLGGGVATVTCCDANCQEHWVVLHKWCIGPMAGVGLSGHVLSGIQGEDCPRGYKGWFVEAALGPFTDFVGEDVGGVGLGAFMGLGVTACHYTIDVDLPAGDCD